MAFLSLLIMAACEMPRTAYVSEANALTRDCARSRLAKWQVHASAAGNDCAVLLIETKTMILEDAMVDALHHGHGAYDLYDGGVGQYARKRSFRGVAYKDKSRRMWRYGEVNETEALQPCR